MRQLSPFPLKKRMPAHTIPPLFRVETTCHRFGAHGKRYTVHGTSPNGRRCLAEVTRSTPNGPIHLTGPVFYPEELRSYGLPTEPSALYKCLEQNHHALAQRFRPLLTATGPWGPWGPRK